MVIQVLQQKETIYWGQVEHNQGKMELLGQQTFAYYHKASATGNLDWGKFVEKIWYKVVVGH